MKSSTLSALNPAKYRAWIEHCAHWHMSPLPGYEITPTDCWRSWHKPRASGYIRIHCRVNGKRFYMQLHTLSLLYANAPGVWRDIDAMLAQGKHPMACHKPICDTDGGNGKACFNPKHLRLDDGAGNTRDRQRDGKTARGEAHGQSKLTAAQVDIIRQEANNGVSQRALGRKYGVHHATIRRILNRDNWANSDGRLV